MTITLQTSTGTSYTLDWSKWVASEHVALTFVRQGGQLLLIRKKRGLGAGNFSAPGGRLEAGETPEQAAVRETQEEVGLTPLGLRAAGRLDFAFTDGYALRCHVYTAEACEGTLTETDEAAPFWCDEADIPYGRMWSDDRLWIPLMLQGRRFDAQFVFEGDLMLWHLLSVHRI